MPFVYNTDQSLSRGCEHTVLGIDSYYVHNEVMWSRCMRHFWLSLCCTMITGVDYKSTAINILYWTCLILSRWTNYSYSCHAMDRDSSEGLIYCSTLQKCWNCTFICIIFYRTYLYFKSTKLHFCFKKHTNEREDRRGRRAVEDSAELVCRWRPSHCSPTRTADELTNSLLTDNWFQNFSNLVAEPNSVIIYLTSCSGW